jgi:FAD/FMN-containing dehydrogenase
VLEGSFSEVSLVSTLRCFKILTVDEGGLSLYSTRHGFACDSITSYTLITASGETVIATSTDSPDLFISLKGGLNNFGIVTAFTMKTIPIKKIWGGIAIYAPTSISQLIQATVDFVKNDEDIDSHVITSANFGFGQGIMNTVCMYQTQGVENGGLALKRFVEVEGRVEIEGYPKLKMGTHIEMCNEISSFVQVGIRYVVR